MRVESPNPFPTSPTPTAPAATSASSCCTAFAAQPGPTFRKSMPASTRTRSLYGDAAIDAIVRCSRSPDMLSAAIIMRTFSESSAAASCVSPSGVPNSPPGWP